MFCSIAKKNKFCIWPIVSVCSPLCQMLRSKIYVCKYIEIRNRGYFQLALQAREFSIIVCLRV